jgi:hypothetical protein
MNDRNLICRHTKAEARAYKRGLKDGGTDMILALAKSDPMAYNDRTDN